MKGDWYGQEGVREYVVLDPNGDCFPEPRLQSWRFHDLAAPPSGGMDHVLADADGILRSDLLPVGRMVEGDWVRLVDLQSGEFFPLVWDLEPRLQQEVRQRQELQVALQEAEERAQTATERAQAEAQARRELEADIARLRRQIEGLG